MSMEHTQKTAGGVGIEVYEVTRDMADDETTGTSIFLSTPGGDTAEVHVVDGFITFIGKTPPTPTPGQRLHLLK